MSGEKDKLGINITIDGKPYPLTIERNDEESYRIAAKKVNDVISRYRELFRDKSSQDILSMAAFQLALENIELQNKAGGALFIEELNNLNDDISDFLKEKEKK